MRRFSLLAFVGILFLSRGAAAGWEELKSQFGDGNNNLAVSSGDCKTVVVLGTAKGGQGDSPVMWLSGDGGQSWQQGTPPQSGMMAFWMDVWMVTANVGYIGGMDFGSAGLMQTINGGSSFIKVPSAKDAQTVNRLFFYDGGKPGFALGDALVMTDNGSMWQKITYDAGEAGMNAIQFANPMEGWMVGGKTESDQETGATTLFDEGTVMHSTDGGKTWATLVSGQPYNYTNVWFPTPERGFLTGFDGSVDRLFTSQDHGQSWTEVALPAHPDGKPLLGYVSMHFADAKNGWLAGTAGQEGGGVGNSPVALHTTDGGLTWAHEAGYNGSGGTFFDVWACNEGEAFFVGDWGKIDKWTKGGFVSPDGAEVIVTESGEVIEPLGPWADVLGGFTDGQVQAGGGQGDTTGSGDGANLPDGTSTTTKEVCTDKEVPTSGGCAMGSFGAPGTSAALLLLGLGALVAGRRRARHAPWARHAVPPHTGVVIVVAIVALVACGGGDGTKTVQECKTVVVQQTFDFDATGGEDGAEPAPAPTCVLTSETPTDVTKPALPEGDGARSTWTNPFLAFARTVGGIDQLMVMDPDSGGTIALTGLEEEGARILATAWSPDRTRVAFLSDFYSAHSTYRSNVFVAGLDPRECFMSTPNGSEGIVAEAIAMRLQGFFKGATGGAGALIAVPDATVGSTRGGGTVVTNQGGGYVIDLPRTDGTLVFRRVARDAAGNEDYWGAVLPYLAAGGMQQQKDVTGRASGANTRIDAFSWRPDGAGFLVARSGKRLGTEGKDEGFVDLAEYDANTGTFTNVALPGDVVAVRHFLPPLTLSGGVRVVPWIHMDRTAYLTFLFGPESSKTIDAPGLFWDDATREGSRVVVSPQDFLAWVDQDGKLVLVGADEQGQLATETRDAFAGQAVVEGDLDWSPDGLHVVVTTKTGDATDLLEVDVNSLEGRALTTDGKSHAPAWYGH